MPPQTVETAMADPSLHHLFDEAIEAIQDTISAENLKVFQHHTNFESMLEDIHSMCASNQKEQQKLIACVKKISMFSHAFAPYFDLVGSLVQVKPDWLSWFWGTVRLVFRVGSNYVCFLEKACDMIKTIGQGLPRYRQLQSSCERHFQNAQDEQLVLLSYMYADMVQFCLGLYGMFSRGAKLRHRSSNLPAAPYWRPLDSRFAHLQQRVTSHKKWLEATALQNDDHLAQRQKDYFDLINKQPEASSGSEAERMGRRMRRIDKVKSWLSNCCAYRDIYEHRNRQRHPNSCSWFLNTPEYCKWKNTPFSDQEANDADSLKANWHDRILFVQASPGFGKTFLSSRVIDDLTSEAEDLNISDEPPTTAFFHFNAAHLYCTHPNDALRALAAELVHTHRHNHSTLDALSLLMRKTSSQEKASSDDVLAVLSLLLRQHSTFLVIDGVDECSDVELFLTLIPELCRKSDTRVIFFSRPDIDMPLEYQKWASDSLHIVRLHAQHNAADIETYVTENLNRLADQGYFGVGMDRSLISHVATRSNGSFLWASLLLKYLQAPELSPNERRVSLEQAHLLEGLDSLYRLVLITLDRKNSRDKSTAADIFRWLALSIKRLCVPKLQTALAVMSEQPIEEDQLLLNLPDNIPSLTCGLVEVTNCSVLFSHRSVKEHLQSAEFQDSDFSLFDESLAQAHLAARCLSYLANNVPKRPLQRLQPYIRPAIPLQTPSSGISIRTGSSRDSGYKSMSSASDTDGVGLDHPQQVPTFDANMPFLRYAALCWPVHLTRALSNPPSRSNTTNQRSSDPFSQTPWLPALSQFLTQRSTVTTWVEASWRYSLPPNLSRLIPLLINIKSEIPPATIEGRELRWVVHGLRQLSDALNELRGDYGATLRDNPSLIWQWNIQAATEGGFWPVWDERRGCVHGAEA